MEVKINGEFCFHNVGQGLFYSGLLINEGNKEQFRFVYDCGSTNKNFLKEYASLASDEKGKKKTLDLLVISHFHDDHVNGIPELLEHFDVDTVVMPYMDDFLRGLAVLEHIKSGIYNADDPLKAMYSNPVEWFAQKGVHRIVVFGSNFPCSSSIPDVKRGSSPIIIDKADVRQVSQQEQTQILYMKDKLCQFFVRNFLWLFTFQNIGFHTLQSDVLDSKYHAKVEQYQADVAQYWSAVQKDWNLEDFQWFYKYTDGYVLNRTSVVMLHTPVNEFDFSSRICKAWAHMCGMSSQLNLSSMFHHESYHTCYSMRPGSRPNNEYPSTLLTGDVIVKEDELEDILSRFEANEYYEKPVRLNGYYEKPVRLVLQYPHHGSVKSGQYVQDISRFISRYPQSIVISHGKENPPDKEIWGKIPFFSFGFSVTEDKAFRYYIKSQISI